MFNRNIELNNLIKAVNSGKAELIVVYGRRRTGKTTLVQELLSKVNGVYLFVPRGGIEDVLSLFTSDVVEQTGDVVRFGEWRDFLEYIRRKSRFKRFVIVLDEFQRLSEAYKPAISMLQHFWDSYLSESMITLILVGSVVGIIEKLALLGDSPLFGRKTRDLKINPLPYMIVRRYWKGYSEEQKIEAYGFFGGTPGYFTLVSEAISPIENVRNLILTSDARLAREPEALLSEETRAPSTYMSILAKISSGRRGLPLAKIKVRRGSPTMYLYTLMKMDLISRLESLAQGDIMYIVEDEFFRFWFRFIYPRQSLIEVKRGFLIERTIEKGKNSYLSFTLEKILRETLLFSSGGKLKEVEIPIIEKIGSYWRGNIEVDACAVAEDTVIIGEAKWRGNEFTRGELEKLLKETYIIGGKLKKKTKTVVISKGGFREEARKFEDERIILLDLKELGRELDKIYQRTISMNLKHI